MKTYWVSFNKMKELIEEAIRYALDGLEYTEDHNFTFFECRVKIKAHNGVLKLKNWLIIFPRPPKWVAC